VFGIVECDPQLREIQLTAGHRGTGLSCVPPGDQGTLTDRKGVLNHRWAVSEVGGGRNIDM